MGIQATSQGDKIVASRESEEEMITSVAAADDNQDEEANLQTTMTATEQRGKMGRMSGAENTNVDYDKESYDKMYSIHDRVCTACGKDIGVKKTIFLCRNCSNGHVLCSSCMKGTEEEKLMRPSKCRHGNYEDVDSYEECTTATYSWMDKSKPAKRCSSCSKESKPTRGYPMYYCKGCRLHRICKHCWEEKNSNAEITNIDGRTEARASRRKQNK